MVKHSEKNTGKQALLIVGMHRSGTSALTRVINLHGVPLGQRVAGPAFDNETGFWENQQIVDLHERMLEALDSAWDDPRPLPDGWPASPDMQGFKDALSVLIDTEFENAPLWAVKDPRLCRFLPLWLDVLKSKKITAKLIFALRHPDEVVASLVKRNQLLPGVAAALWLRYLHASVAGSAGATRCMVSYRDLLSDWRTSMRRVASELDIAWPTAVVDCADAVDAHLQQDLQHQHAQKKLRWLPAPWRDLMAQAHATALDVIDGKQTWQTLDDQLCDAWHRFEFTRPLWNALTPKSSMDANKQRVEVMQKKMEMSQATLGQTHAALANDRGKLVQVHEELAAERSRLLQSQNELAAERGWLTQAREELAAERNNVTHLQNELATERGKLMQLQEELSTERINYMKARDQLLAEQARALQLHDALSVERDNLSQTRTELAVGRRNLAQVQDELTSEKGRLAQAHDELSVQADKLAQAQQDLGIERAKAAQAQDGLVAERNKSVRLKDDLASELAKLAQAQQDLGIERAKAAQAQDELVAEREKLACLQEDALQTRSELARKTAHAAMLDQILASRSWRWTRPLRFAMRVWQHKGISPIDRQQLRRMKAAAVPTPLKPNHPQPVAQQTDMRDYFVWAVIDWHFRIQRPQHLSRELAQLGHRVFYISNNFIDRDDPGFAIESLDDAGRLYQINLHLKSSPAIYHAPPDALAQKQLYASLGRLLDWTQTRGAISMVDHPYWLETARAVPDCRMIYDCMDHHGGFSDNTDDVLAREHELMRDADLLVVTSDWLQQETARYNPHSLTIRNACQYDHFAQTPKECFRDPAGRKIIGYYGAIAEWFDLDLVETVARKFENCLILLVGADTAGAAQRQLGSLPNVQFTGEVPYADLPYYLYAFDVCMLPFRVIPLTLATNPVKVYEYLSAGRHVVSVDLPEIRQFGDLVRIASDHETFLACVSDALARKPGKAQMRQRRQFAAEQTWAQRVRELDAGVKSLPDPRVSVVVVTYNNLDFTKACLESLDVYSDYSNMEVIVVDNASADDTADHLRQWVTQAPDRHIILNDDNRGFAAANNQGLAMATGDYLVMLNNDTHVTPGWVATLVAHMRHHPELGMLGPVTNNIGNEARIEVNYADMHDMLEVARTYTRQHIGVLTPLRTAAFFCVMMPRHVYEKVGELDEAFGIGMFEDDDYCRRVEQAGWTVACAEDVFIHHHLSASFSKVKHETRQAMFESNRLIYETKWGPWIPHRYRDSA